MSTEQRYSTHTFINFLSIYKQKPTTIMDYTQREITTCPHDILLLLLHFFLCLSSSLVHCTINKSWHDIAFSAITHVNFELNPCTLHENTYNMDTNNNMKILQFSEVTFTRPQCCLPLYKITKVTRTLPELYVKKISSTFS